MSIFTQVAMKKPRSNVFDLSHSKKLTTRFGKITPIFLTECVPGDSFRISSAQMLRFSPLISPVMHEVSVYMHFFKVPYRILWKNWETFITAGEDGQQNPTFPTVNLDTDGVVAGSLEDYLGLPLMTSGTGQQHLVSGLPFAAYQKIWNEYYRDQNLDTIKTVDELADGVNAPSLLRRINFRSYQHDYFTSCLPWTQKGPEATIPLGSIAPIQYTGSNVGRIVFTAGTTPGAGDFDVEMQATGAGQVVGNMQVDVGGGTRNPATLDNSASLQADLSSATAATINELRQAYRLQQWMEKNARGGSRYIESILVHFGVKSSDARLQRPEFLGGASTPVTISEVLQTASTAGGTTPQGNMAGHGISVGQGKGFSCFCEEHCLIMGLMTVMPKTAYMQGIPRFFRKFDRFDYFWPSFAHLGEQPVYNSEIFYDNQALDNDDVFGYLPRYAEYKYIPSTVSGDFRTTLDFWTIVRKFANRPQLNASFIKCDPATDGINRIFADTSDNDKFYVQVYHRVKARRRMPYFGTPIT